MKTLNLYIIRHFLINFVILLTVLMLLFVLVDFILDMDEFWEGGRRWAQRRAVAQQALELDRAAGTIGELVAQTSDPQIIMQGLHISHQQAQELLRRCHPGPIMVGIGALWKVFDYYGPLILLIYVFFSGLIVTGAMGFCFTGLHRNGELTAMVAGGISLYRVACPVLIVGILLIGLTLPLQEFVIPALAQKLTRGKGDIKLETEPTIPIYYADMGNGALLSAANFSAEHKKLYEITIIERDAQGLTRRRIRATQALWREAQSHWQLIGGRVQRPPRNNQIGMSLEAVESIDFYPTQLSPTVLLTRQAGLYPQLLPMSKLQQLQHNQAVDRATRSHIIKTVWSRFSLLVLNVLILVMGLPFFLLRAPANMLSQGIKAAGVCIGTWGGGIILLQGGEGILPPVAAAWLPVVIALPMSALFLQTVRT